MAKPYFENMSDLVAALELGKAVDTPLEVKHFFSGAALYSKGCICASLSPAGLAFKLPGDEADQLIASGKALPLRYFPNGHIKSGYALFEAPGEHSADHWKPYFLKAVSAAAI